MLRRLSMSQASIYSARMLNFAGRAFQIVSLFIIFSDELHGWETNIQPKHTIGLHQSVGMIKTTLVQIEISYGAMVAGPDKFDSFLDERKVMVHRATIASNAGLVVALVALHDLPHRVVYMTHVSHMSQQQQCLSSVKQGMKVIRLV
uniref:Uncharacterized protein n=1 Tax=Salix viminalis TaxID=40686 RepID=A0A6N2KLK6_SALVM